MNSLARESVLTHRENSVTPQTLTSNWLRRLNCSAVWRRAVN